MAVIVEALHDTPVARRRVELVERKGIGHPDTMCDALVEAIALALNRMYLERTGAIPHYNIDKALLVAGECTKCFGSGQVMRAMELFVGDRATFNVDGNRLPVEETVREAIDAWLRASLPLIRPGKDLQSHVLLAPGSEELRRIFKQTTAIGSNDTCGASGYAPLTPTEEITLAAEHFLNSAEFKQRFPDTGQDVKVFALRHDQSVEMTIAMPLLCTATPSEPAYFARKAEIMDALVQRFRTAPFEIAWRLNCLDRPGDGTEGVYLSLTGTSAEDADSGEVGRGNRANGLIAFARPTGGEAAPGKNPVAHAGKIYSVLSHRLAQLIHAQCPTLHEVYVHLAARIGEPVDQPWSAVQVLLAEGVMLGDIEADIRAVVEAELSQFDTFQAQLTQGLFPVC
ncbi:MAG TPA: methionine adenosyltransferase [Candidatus Margulisiibacteriota bacterium]|nr:methionine adenosyltransferase [Candidatus Margulisiibacteriota bacterium]